MKMPLMKIKIKIQTNSPVEKIEVENGKVVGVQVRNELIKADVVVASADYHHVDQNLLEPQFRLYSPAYWDSRKMAPSSLIFYLGVDKKIPELVHHNLFFESDFEEHAKMIYEEPAYPEEPLFYVCCPSKTDPNVAPEGKEANWIQTVPDKGWFCLLRLYSPTEAWFDKTWRPGEIELTK